MARCEECIHSRVCVIRGFPSAFENTHWEKEPCDHFKAADVAPRAEWISVEERLPGVSGRYICAVKDKNGHTWTVAGDYNLEMKKWFGLMFGEIKNTVTHWMPLPEPPKANP